MIQQPLYAVISLVLLVVVAGYTIELLAFLKRAERTTGTVIDVTSYNSGCGRKLNSHFCTKYYASVEFLTRESSKYPLKISAGRSRGHNQPLEYADVKVSSQVPVVYDPQEPTKAYEDTTWGVLGRSPIMILLMFSLVSFIVSVSERNRGEN